MKPNRNFAFLAYLIPVVGWLCVFLFRKQDKFAVYHARQSVMLTVAAIMVLLVWGVVAWGLSWIPLAGPLTAATLFALVIAAYIILFAVWIAGMVNALRSKMQPLPLVGAWTEKMMGNK